MDWDVAWERFMRATVCRALGHRFTKRVMTGHLCSRCRTFKRL